MKGYRQSIVFLCDTAILLLICGVLIVTAPTILTPLQRNGILFSNLLILYFATVICQVIFQTYNSLWRYAETREYLVLLIATVSGFFLYLFADVLFLHQRIPLTVLVGISSVWLLGMLFMRFCYRVYRSRSTKNPQGKTRVAIIGAGAAGNQLVHELQDNPTSNYTPVYIFDDDVSKHGRKLCGVPVVGPISKVPEKIKGSDIQHLLIAIPSLSTKQRKQILGALSVLETVTISILPGVLEMVEGTSISSQLRKIKVEDLLGRAPVQLDTEQISSFLNDKAVLVTGGGGSIGSELCRQIAKYQPKQLIIFDIYENNAYDIQQELRYQYKGSLNLSVEIGSVRDNARIQQLFERHHPQIVFHAAAHKHVPLMEDNPREAVLNNVFGTHQLIEAAEQYYVEKFVQISTDKAVNPTNVMGATKRLCEMLLQGKANQSHTEFVAVRFGNVLGSNGSVIPLFQKQIEAGGPLTVTDFRIIRFFMTIPEAAQLVLQAGSMRGKNLLYVLDMGDPVKIFDLAQNMIRCAGLSPFEDIDIIETGLRPGEKLYEELLIHSRNIKKTENQKIYVEQQPIISREEILEKLSLLRDAIETEDPETLRAALHTVVPTFKEAEVVNDLQGETVSIPSQEDRTA